MSTDRTAARVAAYNARSAYDARISGLIVDALTLDPEQLPLSPTRALDILRRAHAAEAIERNPLDADDWPVIEWQR